MDFIKKHILESIGFVVGTSEEFRRMTTAEEAYRRHRESAKPAELQVSQSTGPQPVSPAAESTPPHPFA